MKYEIGKVYCVDIRNDECSNNGIFGYYMVTGIRIDENKEFATDKDGNPSVLVDYDPFENFIDNSDDQSNKHTFGIGSYFDLHSTEFEYTKEAMRQR